MTIALRAQTSQPYSGTPSQTTNVAIPASTQAGDIMVLSLCWNDTVNTPAGWTLQGTVVLGASTANAAARVYTKVATAGDAGTNVVLTGTPTANGGTAELAVYSGATGVAGFAFGSVVSGAGAPASATIPAQTLANASEWMLYGGMYNDGLGGATPTLSFAAASGQTVRYTTATTVKYFGLAYADEASATSGSTGTRTLNSTSIPGGTKLVGWSLRLTATAGSGGTSSSYMPSAVVEMAFGSTYSTAEASRTWTDVSDYVELDQHIRITRGRADEMAQVSPSQVGLTLDNRDGRFSPNLSSGAYYPNIKVGVPIRITSTPVGGAASVRFVGYVDSWPVDWDGTSERAFVKITASSRMARTGRDSQLRSIVETEMLADSPNAYYPLGEASGATQAADISGNNASALARTSVNVTFGGGTGPGTDGLSAPQFGTTTSNDPGTGPRLLGTPVANVGTPAPVTLEAFFALGPGNTGTVLYLVRLTSESGGTNLGIRINTSGNAEVYYDEGGFANVLLATLSGSSLYDGNVHHIAGVFTVPSAGNGQATVYVDGTSWATSSVAAVGWHVPKTYALSVGPVTVSSGSTTATIAHVAQTKAALTGSRIQAHAKAGLTGFAGEPTDVRLKRYAGYTGIPSTEVDAEFGQTTMDHVPTDGKQALELMRVCETTEAGVLFDGKDGHLVMHNRAHRYTKTPALTLSFATQQVQADYGPVLDTSAILNDVSVANVAGTQQGRAVKASSVSAYGTFATSLETASQSSEEPFQRASWIVNGWGDPSVRVPTLSVDAPNCGASVQTLLGLEIGDLLEVTNAPSNAPMGTALQDRTYFIEGYTEDIGPESYVFTFNVTPSLPHVLVFKLDSINYGSLDLDILGY